MGRGAEVWLGVWGQVGLCSWPMTVLCFLRVGQDWLGIKLALTLKRKQKKETRASLGVISESLK